MDDAGDPLSVPYPAVSISIGTWTKGGAPLAVRRSVHAVHPVYEGGRAPDSLSVPRPGHRSVRWAPRPASDPR